MEVLFLCAVLSCLVPLSSGDIPPGIRNIICQTRHGTCRLFFCHSGEKRGEICSDPWDRCCISNAEEEKKNKPVET
ncbi:sperm-associated antigen 11-like [Pteropus medius]|uniref:Sperm-associated antigen 11-like n=1 Tax=Pteropus vampyrus TaxID=132908 RepID=A0A6P3REE4_PTEVA|nr:sperm-associated antigen 11-like [Pteropus vampyrus]XP_039733271.1 sperm-associated antigen 11-like [Pteropus giganteus]